MVSASLQSFANEVAPVLNCAHNLRNTHHIRQVVYPYKQSVLRFAREAGVPSTHSLAGHSLRTARMKQMMSG